MLRKVFCVGLFAGIVGMAQAGPWLTGGKLDFEGLVTGRYAHIMYSTNNGSSFSGVNGGFMQWEALNLQAAPLAGMGLYTGSAGPNYGRFYTICCELIVLDDPQYVNAWYSGDPLLASGIRRAGNLVGTDFDGFGTTSYAHAFGASANGLRAAAFQSMVWAARYGSNAAWSVIGSGTSSVIDIGNFQVKKDSTYSASDWATFKSYAYDYYTKAWNFWNVQSMMQQVVYIESTAVDGGGQDQMTIGPELPPQSVPEPFTMALMGGSALAGYARMRRRRAR